MIIEVIVEGVPISKREDDSQEIFRVSDGLDRFLTVANQIVVKDEASRLLFGQHKVAERLEKGRDLRVFLVELICSLKVS